MSACRPAIQLSQIVTQAQLQQLVRLSVWKDQQQPWAVHAITCLLQDTLNADKQYHQHQQQPPTDEEIEDLLDDEMAVNDSDNYSEMDMEMAGPVECKYLMREWSSRFNVLICVLSFLVLNESVVLNDGLNKLLQAKEATDNVKFAQLPSLMEMECEIEGFDEMFDDIVSGAMLKNYIAAPPLPASSSNVTSVPKSNLKSSVSSRINAHNFYRSVSSSMDQRLAFGLETNIETNMRRWTLLTANNLFASLPTYPNQPHHFNLLDLPAANVGSSEIGVWPEQVLQAWSNDEYQSNQAAVQMLVSVFDTIFEDLDVADSWLNLEQVLQLWLTLNNELSDNSSSQSTNSNRGAGSSSQSSSSLGGQSDTPKIPFSQTAVQGLLSALNCHAGISLRAWSLSFQCLTMAANQTDNYSDAIDSNDMNSYIVDNPQFGQMLYRFYSSADPTSTPDNQCVR